MSNLTLGILSVEILKSKGLQKIENSTKQNVAIKNPIIKIDYVSGTKVSTTAEGQGDEFEWNCKLSFEAIKNKTSFFMQCFNNNTEDSYNLLGETRIPLIMAIENENFKQWYPIYLKERNRQKCKFVCRGEILLDIKFFSLEKIKNDNLDISELLSDDSVQKSESQDPLSFSKLICLKASKSFDSKRLPMVTNNNTSIQPPMIIPRSVTNVSYCDNEINEFKKEEEDYNNRVLYEDMEDENSKDNESCFDEKYNNSYYIHPSKSREDIGNKSFSYSVYLNNKQNRQPLTKSLKVIQRSNSINNAKLERNKSIHKNTLPTYNNEEKRLYYRNNSLPRKTISKEKSSIPIQNLSSPSSSSEYNTSSTLKHRKASSSNESNISTILINSTNTNSPLPLSTVYNNNISFNRNNNSIPRSYHITRNTYNNKRPSDYNISSNQNNDTSFSIMTSSEQDDIVSDMNISQIQSLNQENSNISINDMTSKEKAFLRKMNTKYKKNMIIIDDKDIQSDILLTDTTSILASEEYSSPNKRSKNFFKNIFHIKGSKKTSKMEKKKNKTKPTLKKEKSIESTDDTMTDIVITTIISKSPSNTTKRNLKRKESKISSRGLKREISNISTKILRKKESSISNSIVRNNDYSINNSIVRRKRSSISNNIVGRNDNIINKSIVRRKESNNIVGRNDNIINKSIVRRKESSISNNTLKRKKSNSINENNLIKVNTTMENNKEKKGIQKNKYYQPFTDITNTMKEPQPKNNIQKNVGIKASNIIIPSIKDTTEQNSYNENNSLMTSDSSSTLNKIIEPYLYLNTPDKVEIHQNSNTDKMEESKLNLKLEKIQIDPILEKENRTNNSFYPSTSTPDFPKNNDGINAKNIQYVQSNRQINNSCIAVSSEPFSEKAVKNRQKKRKASEIMDVNTFKDVRKNRKEKEKENENDINRNEYFEKQYLQNDENNQIQNLINSSLYSNEPKLSAYNKMTEMQFQEYSKQMNQKLQYQQLSQRISLSFNHYCQYQDLLKQINEHRQSYEQLEKIKKQLYLQQQDQIRIQNELHSQQQHNLQVYLNLFSLENKKKN
ncbi:hypothetical protein BCR36DRAFT_346112 [Piromyces finnis]|uniref:C2 domain-containing protein n=1 Tax=Piromyces finnis TaxID=1754191 RepID=A0A1Y1VGI5_9FUNG|nr:hypothetical protein BCR36DRAFT_346112 [Piromyces finnis]|eukprot:ORX55838.1 hypothetical protein BCR36DRAFT_346112 [Piromyces finnis]